MLIAITGRNGNGKTLFAISTLLKNEYQKRPIYYTNIRGLSYELGWTEFPDPRKWQELPKGSVLFVDEAHKYFPKAKRAGDMPPCIEMLSEHRGEYSLDIIFCTQIPTSLHHHIRGLINRHIHISRYVDMSEKAKVWEWRKLEEKPDDMYARKLAYSTYEFTYVKDAYELYDSADIHVEKRGKPKALKKLHTIFAIIVIAALVVGYRIYSRVNTKITPENLSSDSARGEGGTLATTARGQSKQNSDSFTSSIQNMFTPEGKQILTTEQYVAMLIPRLDGVPSSAPIYDELHRPVDYPRPYCIMNEKKCLCHTQQSTRLDIDEQQCRNYVENGWFDYSKRVNNTRIYNGSSAVNVRSR